MRIKSVGKPLDEEIYVWRYFTLPKFINFITDKSIVFSRVDLLEDVNEAISLNQLIANYGTSSERDAAASKQTTTELNINERQSRYYVSCWVKFHRESVAMWNSYSNEDGVAIKIKAQQLLNSILLNTESTFESAVTNEFKLYYGLVSYKDFLSENGRANYKDEVKIICFQKDICFKHEMEYRFLLKFDKSKNAEFDYKNKNIIKAKLIDFDNLNIKII